MTKLSDEGKADVAAMNPRELAKLMVPRLPSYGFMCDEQGETAGAIKVIEAELLDAWESGTLSRE